MSLKTEHFKSDFKKNSITDLSEKINDLLKTKIQLEINLDSFDIDYGNGRVLESESIGEHFHNYCFQPLRKTLETMILNETYKEYLEKNLKSIQISNVLETDPLCGHAAFSAQTLVFRAPVTTSGANIKMIEQIIFEAFSSAG